MSEKVLIQPVLYSFIFENYKHCKSILTNNNFFLLIYFSAGALLLASIISYSAFIVGNINARNDDIKVLRSLGCNNFSIFNIFATEGLFIVFVLVLLALIPYFIGLKYFVQIILINYPILDIFYKNTYIPILLVLALFVFLTLLITGIIFMIKCFKKTIKE